MFSPISADMLKHRREMSFFSSALRESYFRSEQDIDTLTDNSEEKKDFLTLKRMIEECSIFGKTPLVENKIKTLFSKNLKLNQYYCQTSTGKEDLVTLALENKLLDLAIFFIKTETDEDRKKRETSESLDYPIHGRPSEEEDRHEKTKEQRAMLLAMYGTDEYSFGAGSKSERPDIAAQLMRECKINPHESIHIYDKESGRTMATTPFMYFLQKNYERKETLSIPLELLDTPFIDFNFKNFDGHNLEKSLINAGAFSMFSVAYQKRKRTKEALEKQQETRPSIKDIKDMTPNLPGF